MKPEDEEQKRRPPRRVLRFIVGVMALGIALLIGIAVVMIVGLRRVASRIDAIRARGEPIMPAEIAFDGPDASATLHAKAPAFRAAMDASPDIYLDDPDWDEVKAWKPLGEHVADVQAFLDCVGSARSEGKPRSAFGWYDIVRATWDPAHRLTECERLGVTALGALREPLVPAAMEMCDVEHVTAAEDVRDLLPDQFQPLSPDFIAPIGAVRTLVDSIPARVLSGDFDVAMHRLAAASRGAASTEGLPWYIGHLAWRLGESEFLRGCRCVLATAPRPLDWRVVLDHLEKLRPRADFERALVGERTFGIRTFRALRDGAYGIMDGVAGLHPSNIEFMLLDSYDFAFYLDAITKEIERARMPLPLPDFAKEDGEIQVHRLSAWAPVTCFLLPKIREGRELTLMTDADVLLARIAIEANVHGADAAADMAARSFDPFDGKPIRTRIEPGVFSVWSVGPDRVDQSGSSHPYPPESERRLEPHDLIWRVRTH